MVLIIAAPNPLWFVSRGLGAATLVLLTASLAMGIVAGAGARSPAWPRFASAGLHRNLSLFTLALLAVHVVTAVVDPYARIAWRDVYVPFGSLYRPLWVGLGTVSLDLLVAVAVTTAVRRRIGYRAWRLLHWTGYACWPPAMLHALGTGTDTRTPWMAAIGTMCLLSVGGLVAWRVASGRLPLGVRGVINTATLSGTIAVFAFTAAGPLQPGWARAAGTPQSMIAGGRKPPPGPRQTPQSLVDPATGAHRVSATIVTTSGGSMVLATDLADPTVQLVVRPARPGESAPALAVLHDRRLGCVAAVTVSDLITARCGSSILKLKLEGMPASPSGWLWIEPAP